MDKIWHQHYQNLRHEIEWRPLGFMADVIDSALRQFADRPAAHCLGTTLSCGQIDRHSRNLAAYLQHIGCAKGDRVT